ncbi:hypothetical protein JOB18_028317 [Solea senegalensis]|uniref:Uncharacterized protein n=1 Tax=Solea senegalensis TaxID=28829 RepID=A0AAV6Q0U6_SOLSE|nr:hypothetical protein JOB18_028317 [Solea senegalensis]
MESDKKKKRPTEVLLDISEEAFLKELEPYEYHGYSGIGEAVCGWARAAPLSCILLTRRENVQPKTEAAANPVPLSVDPALLNKEGPAGVTEPCSDPQTDSNAALKKPTALNQEEESLSDAALAAQQLDAQEEPDVDAVQDSTSPKNLEEEGTLKETPLPHLSSKSSDNKDTHSQKKRYRARNIVKNSPKPHYALVPITHLTVSIPDAQNLGSGKKSLNKRVR